MPLKWLICLDNQRIEVQDCLKEKGCRMGDRCATRSYLQLISKERVWTGKPSTTQLINGTMCAFLRLTNDYAIMPGDRSFMIHGTKGHGVLEGSDDEYSILEERFSGEDTDITGIADVLECEGGKNILIDYKTSGSFKVAKALGFYIAEEETGEVYKSGKRKGEAKTRKILKKDDIKIDRWEWEMQLNKYRIEFEKRGFKVDDLKIMCVVRDGNTYIARSRGVFRNIYYFKINRIPDSEVLSYFNRKKIALETALVLGKAREICTAQENWDGIKCQNYCEVAEFCQYGKYLKKEREVEDMPIKGLTEVMRMPRLGKIRLGIKKISANKKEYPAEVDYFILDPQTPSPLENEKLIQEFHRLYGEKPKSINFMFPVVDDTVFFPQFYKRYGSSTMLKCKGDGECASCSSEEYAKGLEPMGLDEMGLIKVKCPGEECPYIKSKECSKVGTLQILLPELPGIGVWQITTGSTNSIKNINGGIRFVKAACGRAHMIPLKLERVYTEIAYEGKKTKHYILNINNQIRLADIQKLAQIDATKMLIDLPAPEEDKEDILYRENVTIEAGQTTEAPPEVQKPPEKAKPASTKKTKAHTETDKIIGHWTNQIKITDAHGLKSLWAEVTTRWNSIDKKSQKILLDLKKLREEEIKQSATKSQSPEPRKARRVFKKGAEYVGGQRYF